MLTDSPISIFSIPSTREFEKTAVEVFKKQALSVKVYRDFVHYLGIAPEDVKELTEIPFLPVELFKSHKILADGLNEEIIFTSSATSGSLQSKHYVANTAIYEESFIRSFQMFYGPVPDYCILALLPSYLERSGSSLVYMMDTLIRMSRHPDSGFYLHDYEKLFQKLVELNRKKQKTLLVGVSFALLELSEKFNEDLSDIIVMETGGMKGRGKEIIREEMHARLKVRFNLSSVHSEYGMTEMLSQAYSQGNGIFYAPPWMKVMSRDSHDPFEILSPGKTGTLNIIDLANIYSCSFLATSDLGKVNQDGSFEILGRIDNSDIRGCNLMITG